QVTTAAGVRSPNASHPHICFSHIFRHVNYASLGLMMVSTQRMITPQRPELSSGITGCCVTWARLGLLSSAQRLSRVSSTLIPTMRLPAPVSADAKLTHLAEAED